jgi:hypothetical protein
MDMTYETRDMMLRLLRLCIDTEIQVENIRYHVSNNLTISLRQVFENIDWSDKGFVTKAEIKRLIDSNLDVLKNAEATQVKVHPEAVEVEGLMRRFNKDKLNGKFSLIDFIDEMS